MDVAALPRLDEHAVEVAADRDAVWRALAETLDASFSHSVASAYARTIGCENWTASGSRPLDVGSTVPGFHITAAVRGRELVLEGRHRFSTYALVFRIEDDGRDRSRLRAESRAEFPGIGGSLYRLLVLRTGAHVAGVRRLLGAVRRRAEQREDSAGPPAR